MEAQDNKRDAGKERVELLPIRPLLIASRVFAYGANKYNEWSWTQVDNWAPRYYASTLRHLFAWRRGEPLDKESGMSHLAHAMTNLIIMVEMEERDAETRDDS